ncbi:transcription termination factor MTERF4, chloroplastic-like [Abrus precatorius]|uniref:Transcription termination factor MTERF4, chloroplastic-like n=1 Tax=Abrus precatorius TaxID=3816 RepID=A0A8B8KCT3_ABRPR|nr:transcription termination factor MTERF4, chloroplastic-like [Abrus precatorius]
MPNVLITRLIANASSFTHFNNKGTLIQFASLLQQKHYCASLFLFNSCISHTSNPKDDTFTVSYLINSCGVSPTLAIKHSQKMNFENPDGPNAVLHLLKNYGFSKTHVAKFVAKYPRVLTAKVENNLLPKLKFFSSIGVSNIDMPEMLIANPFIFGRSLKKCLIPRYEILKSVVCDDKEVVRTLKKSAYAFTYCNVRNILVPNIEILRQCGVPQASISLLMAHYPRVVYCKHSRFVEAVKKVEQIGFDALKTTFVFALQVLLTMSKEVWESRIEVYEKWGWSHDMAIQAFRTFPNFMKLSEEMVTKKMSFLVKDMGLPSEVIAKRPQILAYNLEKRIIPRFSVIKILQSKGLFENNLSIGSLMSLTEEKFLKKFVINFQQDFPHLPDVYQDNLINRQNVL